jgi:hypothetical protein
VRSFSSSGRSSSHQLSSSHPGGLDNKLHLSRSRPSSFPRPWPFRELWQYSVGISLETPFNRRNLQSHGADDGRALGSISRLPSLVLVDR